MGVERINSKLLKWATQMMVPFAVIRETGGGGGFKGKTNSVLDLVNLRYSWYGCGEIH